MKILKFGGASVKDAQGVKNLTKVLEITGTQKTLIVVSAMGKTTNSLEIVIDNYFNAKHKLQSSIQEIKKYHNQILLDLFNNDSELIFKKVSKLFDELTTFFEFNKSPNYDFADRLSIKHSGSKKSLRYSSVQDFSTSVNSQNGLLEAKGPLVERMKNIQYFTGDLHSYDVMLFWGCLRQNIKDRINAFL